MTFTQQATGLAERNSVGLQHGVRLCKAAAHSWKLFFTRNQGEREGGDWEIKWQNSLKKGTGQCCVGTTGYEPLYCAFSQKGLCIPVSCVEVKHHKIQTAQWCGSNLRNYLVECHIDHISCIRRWVDQNMEPELWLREWLTYKWKEKSPRGNVKWKIVQNFSTLAFPKKTQNCQWWHCDIRTLRGVMPLSKNLEEAELYFGWLHITPVQNGKWILHFMTFVFSLSLLSKWNHAVCISCSKGSVFHQHVAKQDDKLCWLIFSLIHMPLFQVFIYLPVHLPPIFLYMVPS